MKNYNVPEFIVLRLICVIVLVSKIYIFIHIHL